MKEPKCLSPIAMLVIGAIAMLAAAWVITSIAAILPTRCEHEAAFNKLPIETYNSLADAKEWIDATNPNPWDAYLRGVRDTNRMVAIHIFNINWEVRP